MTFMKKLYFGLFLAIMVIGGVSIFATGEKTFSENENRYLKTFDNLNVFNDTSGTAGTVNVTDEVEATLADQFPGRDMWLTIASSARYFSGAREINDTYIGSDGYLFAKCSEADFNSSQFQKNLTAIQRYQEFFNADLSVVLVPSPALVLAEKLPANAMVYDADSKYQMVYKALADSDSTDGDDSADLSRVEVVDLRDLLTGLDASGVQTYYKTDHHWTTFAAQAAYLKMFEGKSNLEAVDLCTNNLVEVSDCFHGTIFSRVLIRGDVYDSIYSPCDFLQAKSVDSKAGLSTLYDETKLDTKNQYAYFLGGNEDRVDIEGSGSGSILVIKDSFANSFIPFLTQKYAHITVVDLRFLQENVKSLMANGGEEGTCGYDKVLILYEMSNFASDNNLYKLARGLR